MKVNVVDGIMGSGKTTAMIKLMNADKAHTFIFITPLLTEVERIVTDCSARDFRAPKSYGNKLNGLKALLKSGKNIAMTHSLFLRMDETATNLIKEQNYILVIDEVITSIVTPILNKTDTHILLSSDAIDVDENKIASWNETDYPHTVLYSDIKKECKAGRITLAGDVFMHIQPFRIFSCFNEIYVLTYMFEYQLQKYYFDILKADYEYVHVEGLGARGSTKKCVLAPGRDEVKHPEYRKLINICQNRKMNEIGEEDTALSKNWYRSKANNKNKVKLRQHCVNFFKHITQSPASKNLWTTYKEYEKTLKGQYYASCFLAMNSRGTNEFMDRTAVAYLVNRYLSPEIVEFFAAYDIKVDEDKYALSEMVQFIWRSAIRLGKKIDIYIPSSRMRTLLEDWIENIS